MTCLAVYTLLYLKLNVLNAATLTAKLMRKQWHLEKRLIINVHPVVQKALFG
jgi:hypothetical protein